MYAASVNGSMYCFLYSPLGLPCKNIQWLPEPAPMSQGVRFYERTHLDEPWRNIQWPADLWWMRFLLVGHTIHLGTKHEQLCAHKQTSVFLAWWLRGTSIMQRKRFFRDPDILSLLRTLRLETSQARHPWLHGHSGLLQTLIRIRREVKQQHPIVLRPCDMDDRLQYSAMRSAQTAKELLQSMEQPLTAAFMIPFVSFESQLLLQYGCLASEALGIKSASTVSFPCNMTGASIQRYRELGCSVLEFQGDRYITLSSVEQAWSNFAGTLCKLLETVHVVLLDAPIQARRRMHTVVHQATGAVWVVDSPATVTNIREEIGADATTLRYYAPADGQVVVADGMHRMSLRQQAELLQKVLSKGGVKVLLLGGDTTGRGLSRGRAMDGWTLCCHALHLGGGVSEVVDVLDADGLRERWLAMNHRNPPSCRLVVWTCRNATCAAEFQQCSDINMAMVGTKRRWLCAPVSNSHLVSWVCQNVSMRKGTMLVVNWESECRTAAAHCHVGQHLEGFELCDGTEPYVGQDVRCVMTLRGRMRVGEVLHVVGPVDNTTGIALQNAGAKGITRVTKEELRSCCRPARLSLLYEQLNSYYAQRPVLVILSHTSSQGPAMRQEWDPLYTGLGLGGVRNVTIVASQTGLDKARSRMLQLLGAKPPEIPRIWQQFVVTLADTGIDKNNCQMRRRERKREET